MDTSATASKDTLVRNVIRTSMSVCHHPASMAKAASVRTTNSQIRGKKFLLETLTNKRRYRDKISQCLIKNDFLAALEA